MSDDLETLAFEAKRLASISFRLAESLLGRRHIGADGLREYRLNDDQVNDLMFLLGEQGDTAAAIEREAQLTASQRRYFRMNEQLAQRVVAHEEAWRHYRDRPSDLDEAADAALFKAWGEAEDAFFREPCRTIADTMIKLSVVVDNEQIMESLDDRWIGDEDGALVFIRSLMPQVDEGDNAGS